MASADMSINDHVSCDRSDAWRVVHVTEMMGHLWVIHAFQTKSKTGIKTPKAEIDLVRTRLARLKRERPS